MLRKVLVLGGTGFVGRHVCEKLARLGVGLTVPTRRRRNAGSLATLPTLDLVETDIHDSARLAALLPGHDAVVNLVAILQGDEAAFERTHVLLPQKLAHACQQAGVRRLVHISALGADLRNPAGLPSMYLRSKSRGEQVLHQADLALTLIRPSVIFGAEDRFLNIFADLQRIAPFVPLAGAQARLQPVWVEDVAAAVVACLSGPHERDSVGQIYEAFGPEVYTLAELVQLAGRISGVAQGRGRPVLPLPPALAWLQARLMELMPGEPLLSRDNLQSLSVPNVATGHHPGLQALGITAASLQVIAPTYLGHRGWRSTLMARRQGR
jgi:NADH dehydrogenase